MLHIILAIFLLAFLTTYLFAVNFITSSRFSIGDMKKEIEKLKDENYSLSVYVSELKTMNNLELEIMALGLEDVNNIKYIKAKSASPLVLKN